MLVFFIYLASFGLIVNVITRLNGIHTEEYASFFFIIDISIRGNYVYISRGHGVKRACPEGFVDVQENYTYCRTT